VLGHGQWAATELQPAALSSGVSEPLNGSKVQTIQKMIAAGGVNRMSSSGPSVVRTNWIARLSLPAAQLVSLSAVVCSGMRTFHHSTFAPLRPTVIPWPLPAFADLCHADLLPAQ
jgi:hypothetical protein